MTEEKNIQAPESNEESSKSPPNFFGRIVKNAEAIVKRLFVPYLLLPIASDTPKPPIKESPAIVAEIEKKIAQPHSMGGVEFDQNGVCKLNEQEFLKKVATANKGIVFGDSDHYSRDFVMFLANSAKTLSDSGIKVFFIETGKQKFNEKLKKFYQTGDEHELQFIRSYKDVGDEYVELIKKFKEAGIRVYCMDIPTVGEGLKYLNSPYYTGASQNIHGYTDEDLPEELKPAREDFYKQRHNASREWIKFIKDVMDKEPEGTRFGCFAGTAHQYDSLNKHMNNVDPEKSDFDDGLSQAFSRANIFWCDLGKGNGQFSIVKGGRESFNDEPEATIYIPEGYAFQLKLEGKRDFLFDASHSELLYFHSKVTGAEYDKSLSAINKLARKYENDKKKILLIDNFREDLVDYKLNVDRAEINVSFPPLNAVMGNLKPHLTDEEFKQLKAETSGFKDFAVKYFSAISAVDQSKKYKTHIKEAVPHLPAQDQDKLQKKVTELFYHGIEKYYILLDIIKSDDVNAEKIRDAKKDMPFAFVEDNSKTGEIDFGKTQKNIEQLKKSINAIYPNENDHSPKLQLFFRGIDRFEQVLSDIIELKKVKPEVAPPPRPIPDGEVPKPKEFRFTEMIKENNNRSWERS